MIKFEKFESHKGESYSCVVVPTNVSLGYLHKERDGFYYFFPNHIPGTFWPGHWMKEIVNRLVDLNEANTQRVLAETYGHATFTD